MSEKARKPAKSRGRPKNYDPEVALDRALEAFWEGGFAATSLDALASATGMNRPSLYAAFGDKQSLYLKAMDRFSGSMREAVRGKLFNDGPLADALTGFYMTAIELYLSGDEGPRGCFVIGTAPSEAPHNETIRIALDGILKEIDDGFAARLTLAKEQGELPADTDPAALAMVASACLHSLGVRARAGEPRKALNSLASQAVRLIAPEKK